MYQVKTTPSFDKDIKKLDPPVAKRITGKMEWLAEHPKQIPGPMKYLPKDLKGLRKYRVGEWRVLFWIDSKKKLIILYGVEHRSKIYKKFQ